LPSFAPLRLQREIKLMLEAQRKTKGLHGELSEKLLACLASKAFHQRSVIET
jgi:hypothetical protein